MASLMHVARLVVVAAGAGVLGAICWPSRAAEVGVASAQREVFWTWSKLEPDSVASAWLLRRFAAPGCQIELVPRGELTHEGQPFDIPFAALSRTRVQSTFHVLCERRAVDDPRVLGLERLIDEIEVGGWDRLKGPQAQALEAELRAAIDSAPTPEQALDLAAGVLDRWHARMPRSLEN
jgi:hypothetical protein